jgi:hypothetical protein
MQSRRDKNTKPGKRGFQLWLKCLSNCFNVYRDESIINSELGKIARYLSRTTRGIITSKLPRVPSSQNLKTHIPVESRKKTTAIYKNDRSQCCRTQHLPSDCIPISLRLNRKRNILIATYSPIMKQERIIPNERPHWTHCFIENTIVTDDNKFRQLFSKDEFTIYIASDGGVHNHEGTF